MTNRRRDFLKKTGLLGAWLTSPWMAGAKGLTELTEASPGEETGAPGDGRKQIFNMCGYRAPRLETVRIGFVGLGNRGVAAVPRINYIDGISINALCDIRPERVQMAKESIRNSSYTPALYSGK